MSQRLPTVQLKPGREKSAARGHQWLFSGALATSISGFAPGTLAEIVSASGSFVGRGYVNPKSDIAVRILTTQPDEAIDQAFFARRITRARDLRGYLRGVTDAYRLINAEGDFLPGVIVDSYAGVLVVQMHTAGMDRQTAPFVAALQETLQPRGIVLRNDVAVRKREGLTLADAQVVAGDVPDDLVISENGFRLAVDVTGGQKTGFYADQRDKRAALARYAGGLTGDAPILVNCYAYTGGFSIYAAAANSALRTINVDISAPAIEAAQRNMTLNDLDPARHEFVVADVPAFLQEARRDGKQYDGLILDPPAFAKTHNDVPQALAAYNRLNTTGMAILKPGGLLVTCSCSGSVSLDEFTLAVSQAALNAGRRIQLLETFRHGLDHPIALATPESAYLKVLFCRVE